MVWVSGLISDLLAWVSCFILDVLAWVSDLILDSMACVFGFIFDSLASVSGLILDSLARVYCFILDFMVGSLDTTRTLWLGSQVELTLDYVVLAFEINLKLLAIVSELSCDSMACVS